MHTDERAEVFEVLESRNEFWKVASDTGSSEEFTPGAWVTVKISSIIGRCGEVCGLKCLK
jgi:hypothetical protein